MTATNIAIPKAKAQKTRRPYIYRTKDVVRVNGSVSSPKKKTLDRAARYNGHALDPEDIPSHWRR